MADDLLYRVAELERIVGTMIRMGTVAEADYEKARVRVKSGGITTGWLQWATTRAMGEKTWWAPRVGEQVMVFSPCGDLTQGKVLMAFYQDSATPPANSPDIHRCEYPDGAFIEYDETSSTLKADVPGHADIKAGETISAEAGQVINLKAPLINILGDVVNTGHGGGTGTVTETANRTIEGSLRIIGPIECDSLTVNGATAVGSLTTYGNSHAASRSGGTI